MRIKTKEDRRDRIKFRIRKRMTGTARQAAPERVPQRVAHLRAGDRRPIGQTIASASTRRSQGEGPAGRRASTAATSRARKLIGTTIAERLKEKGITKVVFDRNGFLYHGRVRAVAEAARSAGLEF